MSTTRNIDIWQGSQHVEIWRALDGANNPVNFTGISLRITVENSKGRLVTRRNLATGSDITGDSASVAIAAYGSLNGCIEVKLTEDETKNIDSNSKYEIEPVVSNVVKEPYFHGTITAKSELKNA